MFAPLYYLQNGGPIYFLLKWDLRLLCFLRFVFRWWRFPPILEGNPNWDGVNIESRFTSVLVKPITGREIMISGSEPYISPKPKSSDFSRACSCAGTFSMSKLHFKFVLPFKDWQAVV